MAVTSELSISRNIISMIPIFLATVPIARNETFKGLKVLEREPLRHCKGYQKVTFIRYFTVVGHSDLVKTLRGIMTLSGINRFYAT